MENPLTRFRGVLGTALLATSLTCATPSLLAADVSLGIGANKFDLALQYLGRASGGDGSPPYVRVERAMARKAIADAHTYGIPYFRVAITGFAPSQSGKPGDLDLWLHDRPRYWAAIDEMMKDLRHDDIRLVPTFVWNPSQFPAMAEETVGDLLRNPDSRSYRLLAEYVTEFTTRYRGSGTVVFYELTNELNLGADLDLPTRCRSEKFQEQCPTRSSYATDDVINFVGRLSRLVKSLDSHALVSSGFAAPRPGAVHLSKRPELPGRPPDWGKDSLEEMENYLGRVHKDLDIISVHLYPGDESKRFGSEDPVDFLVALKRAADKLGKPLFVGEFGDPEIRTARPGSFVDRMLDKLAALKVPYSAIWVWEFHQRNLYGTSAGGPDAYNVEPGDTDRVLAHLAFANATLRGQGPARPAQDTKPPNVVITWPLDCRPYAGDVPVQATASDDSGSVSRVEFWLDGGKIATADTPPYTATPASSTLTRGEHMMTAKAYDPSGNHAEYSTRILVGPPAPGSQCAMTR